MYCIHCNHSLIPPVNFCSNCGMEVRKTKEVVLTNKGKANVNNIGNHNTFHVQHIENYKANNEPITIEYNVDHVKEVPIKSKNLTISGASGIIFSLLGNLASILSIFGIAFYNNQLVLSPLWSLPLLLLLVFSFAVFIIGVDLKRRGFAIIPTIFGRSIKLIEDENGQVKMIKLDGKCPICRGNVKVINVENRLIGICFRNPSEHRFHFDHTTYKGILL